MTDVPPGNWSTCEQGGHCLVQPGGRGRGPVQGSCVAGVTPARGGLPSSPAAPVAMGPGTEPQAR